MKLTPETAHEVKAERRGKRTVYICKRCKKVEPPLKEPCPKASQPAGAS